WRHQHLRAINNVRTHLLEGSVHHQSHLLLLLRLLRLVHHLLSPLPHLLFSTDLHLRHESPCMDLHLKTTSSSVRFSIDNRQTSPNRSFSAVNRNRSPFPTTSSKKNMLMFADESSRFVPLQFPQEHGSKTTEYTVVSSESVEHEEISETNSLVRIGTVEGGEWVNEHLRR
ncbi:tRNA modification GTPase MnmE, partial [Bienertia sinuspersici]